MAVIPGNSQPVPDSGQSVESIHWMQDVTEDTPKQQMREQVGGKISGARNSLMDDLLGEMFRGFQNIVNGINDYPSWMPDSAIRSAEAIRDGQADLNERTDILSPLLDYASLYAPDSNRGHASWGSGRVPFTEILGQTRGVSFRDGGIVLEDKGLWDIRSRIEVSWTGPINNADIQVSLEVHYPESEGGGIYSIATATEKTTNVTHIPLDASVQVPGPGYWVGLNVEKLGLTRGVLGGPRWTRLTVQHITRDIANGDGNESSTDDNETVED